MANKRTKKATGIGDAIRKAVADAGWSTAEATRRAGVSYSMAWRFLNGSNVDLRTAERFAAALGMKLVQDSKGARK